MTHLTPSARAALAAALALVGPHALAQTPDTNQQHCVLTGAAFPEPAGDRDGHAIQFSTGTCTIAGGAFDGSVVTQHALWEMDGPKASLTAGYGVIRKTGGVAAYQTTSGTRTLVLKDGKVVGWTATGTGRYTMAAGSAAAAAGKPFSWTAKSSGMNQYTIDVVTD